MNEQTEKESMDAKDKIIWERMLKHLHAFDVSAIRDEAHLRMLIMDRVLESAERMFTVSANGGEDIPLHKLPEDEKGERLNDLLTKILGDVKGPGPVLRHHVAMLILHYRMLLRLRKLLPALTPSTPKHKNAEEGIRHIEQMISMWMYLLYLWPLDTNDQWNGQLSPIGQQVLRELQEKPSAKYWTTSAGRTWKKRSRHWWQRTLWSLKDARKSFTA